jgi:four helix bundle protein
MSTYKRFEDIPVWQEAGLIRREIYKLTSDQKFKYDFGLRQQLLNCSGSVMHNIAEGFERDGNKEFIQFLYVSKASCGEVKSQLYVCLDENYITEEYFRELYSRLDKLSNDIANFINYLRGSEFKGIKKK